MPNKIKKFKPLFEIGDLVTEFIDGLELTNGIVTKISYNKDEQQYFYSIKWSDLNVEVSINEAIMNWRIENEIWNYYKVVK